MRTWKKLFLALIATLILLILPWILPSTYALHVIILALVYAVLATSLNLVTGYSGLLSLGHQAFFGIGAYTSALLAVDLHFSFPGAFVAAGCIAALAAYIIGSITLRFRSAYFVISTIAFAEMLRLISLNWYSLTRGPLGVTNIPPPSLGTLIFDTPAKAYYFILLVTLGTVLVAYRLVNSQLGRVLIGLREAEYVAKAVGINPKKYLILCVTVSGFMAGVAGSFYAHYIKFLSPDVFYFGVAVNLVIMVIGGGIGTIAGPILGAFVFTIIPEVLRASDQFRLIIYGLVLILIVRFLPGGLYSLLFTLWRKFVLSRMAYCQTEGGIRIHGDA